VIHVLVVSGQHLAVLGGFLHVLLRLTRLRSRTVILLVVIVLWSYALLTGARPSVVRAAATASVLALAQLLRRPAHPVDSLAAAWVLVLLLNPADVNDIGCLLSFDCVAALYWLDQRWRKTEEEIDPIERLKEESRPAWLRQLRWLGGMVLQGYLVS